MATVLDNATLQFVPTNYTRDPSGSEDIRALAAHLRGLDVSTGAGFAAIGDNSLLAAGNLTLMDQSTGVGFWTSGPNNELTIATNTDRTHTLYHSLLVRPDTWNARIVDTIGCSVNFSFFFRTFGSDAYPGIADLAVSSSSLGTVGTRRTIAIDFTSVGAAFASLVKIVIENRGDNSLVECNSQWPEFPLT